MFIKLTNQEQENLLMVLAALFCLWVVWKLVNHRHDKITGEVMNSGKLRRLLPTYEGMTSEKAEALKTVVDEMLDDEVEIEELNKTIDSMVDGGGGGGEDEEGGGGGGDDEGGGGDEEGGGGGGDDEDEEGGGNEDEEGGGDDEGFGNYYEGFQKEDDFEQYDEEDEPFGNTIEGQDNEEEHDTCELFYGLKKCSEIDNMEFDSDADKTAMMKHCKKCKK